MNSVASHNTIHTILKLKDGNVFGQIPIPILGSKYIPIFNIQIYQLIILYIQNMFIKCTFLQSGYQTLVIKMCNKWG